MAKQEVEMVESAALGPKIVVIGVGGAGGNAVNNMVNSNLEGVTFVVANTDAQALNQSSVAESQRIQLGLSITQGLGAGSKPDVGRAAAEESHDEILKLVSGANMVFITAGMGGGTGTGAAPVIAKLTREAGILTVGVVTKPFLFEGTHRMNSANEGLENLQQYVDTLLVIPNQNLFRLANEGTTFADAFKMADNVLYSGVRGVTDLMIMPGLINLDFADIRAIMSEMGKAMMGTGEAEGERRALDAAEAAISNPLLDDVSLQGAKGVLINITGGYDMTLYEVDEAANRVRDEVDPGANIIFGSTFDERLNGKVRVSIVATGIDAPKDNPFKNREVSGVSGFSKQDDVGSFFDIPVKKEDERGESAPEEKRLGRDENEERYAELGQEQKKRTVSFFDRFSKTRRRAVQNNEFEQQPLEKSEVKMQQAANDDLDIPACFRKKR
jgi:cell division protein FtsZ